MWLPAHGTAGLGEKQALISSYNSLGGGRYFDVESRYSFEFDHLTQVWMNIFMSEREGERARMCVCLLCAMCVY